MEQTCENCKLGPKGSSFGCQICCNNFSSSWQPKDNDDDSNCTVIEGKYFTSIIGDDGIINKMY